MSGTAARLHGQGKVRDIYDVGDDRVLLVATDRISAFDVVLPDPIPDKGRVLTGLTLFWLERTTDVVPNHLASADRRDFPEPFRSEPALAGRAMLARRAEVIPVECVVRGYLTGSGLKQYRAEGQVCGVALPGGLDESGVNTSSISISSPSANPNSNFVSARRIPRSPAIPAPRSYRAIEISRRRSASPRPTRSTVSSNVSGRSCPAAAFVVGVKIGAGSLEDSSRPPGSATPHT